MFCPRFRKVVQSSPEGGQFALNLSTSAYDPKNSARSLSYHQLSHNTFIEIFRAHVNSLSNKIASVHMFLTHTALPLLQSGSSLLLQFARLSLMFCFSPCFQAGYISVIVPSNPEQRKVCSDTSAMSFVRRVGAWLGP